MKVHKEEELYWMDTKWGCGVVAVVDGIVIDSCPIFKRKFMGKKLKDLCKICSVKKVEV